MKITVVPKKWGFELVGQIILGQYFCNHISKLRNFYYLKHKSIFLAQYHASDFVYLMIYLICLQLYKGDQYLLN